jgi:hypothetical protein
VKNEKVLHRAKDDGVILNKIRRWKANCIGHFLRKNCLLKHVIERKIEERTEVVERRGRRYKQLLDDFKNLENIGS